MCLQLTLIPLSLVHSLSLTLSHSLKKFFKLAASNRIRRALRNRPAVMQVDAVTCWRVIHHGDELSWGRGVTWLKTFEVGRDLHTSVSMTET